MKLVSLAAATAALAYCRVEVKNFKCNHRGNKICLGKEICKKGM